MRYFFLYESLKRDNEKENDEKKKCKITKKRKKDLLREVAGSCSK